MMTLPQKFSVRARLISSTQHSTDTFEHEYFAPEIAQSGLPGQFVHIRVSDTTAPLLRRPISILDCSPKTGILRILFKVIRQGTAILASHRIGDEVEIAGPLGQPFPWDATRNSIMIAGGYGISPVLFLARRHREEGKKCTIIYGARTADDLLLTEEIHRTFHETLITTNDGSAGESGMVTAPLDRLLKADSNVAVYACGPTPMLRAISEMTLAVNPEIPCRVSMENRMGCGVGVCGGCVVQCTDGKLRTVCKEGPVFDARIIDFSANMG